MNCHNLRTHLRAPLLFNLGITFGAILLLGGLCMLLICAFVPYLAAGLKIAAVLCSLGVVLMLVVLIIGMIGMYRWQWRQLNRPEVALQASSPSNSNGCEKRDKKKVYQFATLSSFSTSDTETLTHLKKKAASTTSFPPLHTLQEGEMVKVVGVLHGTISASALNFSNPPQTTDEMVMVVSRTASEDVWRSSVQLSGSHNNTSRAVGGSAKYNSKPFVRDKSVRRSLPRVLVHPPGPKLLDGLSSGVLLLDSLAKSKSEGVKLDDLSKTNSNEKLAAKSEANRTDGLSMSTGPKNMYREVSFMQDAADDQMVGASPLRMADATTPTGQGSLFNLTAEGRAISAAGQGSGISLEGVAASRRVLLMNQSGQVISCTTLFNNDDDDDTIGLTEEDDESNGDGIRCRHLQNCSGLSFFPLYFERNRSTGDELSHYPTESAEENRHRMDNIDALNQQQTVFNVVSRLSIDARPSIRKKGLWPRIRNIFQHLWPPLRHKLVPCSFSETSEALLRPVTPTTYVNQSQPGEADYSIQIEQNNYSVESKDCISSTETTTGEVETKKRKLTVMSNASVFSLPATSPDKWTIDQPLWIMGVPVNKHQDEIQHHRTASSGTNWLAAAVDAYDHVILVRKNERARRLAAKQRQNGDCPESADSVNDENISSPYTFMHALHVRPPPRMRKPRSQLRTQSRRTTSLGRMLTWSSGSTNNHNNNNNNNRLYN